MSYRKYDDSIKSMIIKSGNPNLFPELKIPRMTALYWIKKAKKKVRLDQINYDKALLDKIENLKKELNKEKAKNHFLKEILRGLHGKCELYSKDKNKKHIVETVERYEDVLQKTEMCFSIGLRANRYYKLKIDVRGCPKIGFKACKIQAPNQLTLREQEKIHDLAMDPKLSHLSIRGLQYYAFREGILSCGYDTWLKYVKEFRGTTKRIKRKRFREGVRAKKVNEIWHMDVTEFKLKDGKKAYLQVLMDNFSRKIIHWNLSFNRKQSLSVTTLFEATKSLVPQFILTDEGRENVGAQVKRLLHGKGITSLIAKKDILFSNSMVESFFRTLKNRFLNKFRRYKFSKIYHLIRRSIFHFNSSPMPVLEGARPNEIFEGSVNPLSLREKLKTETSLSSLMRPEINRYCLNKKICNS